MFGIYRVFLAIEVAIFHIVAIPNIGPYAVHAFFVLSGYLMTLVMKEQYSYSLSGQMRFVMNRALRLYPINACAIVITVVALLAAPPKSMAFLSSMFIPANVGDWLANFFMIYPQWSPIRFQPLLVPQSWALTIELFYYAAIALGVSRTRKSTLVWFALSAVASTYLVLSSGALVEFNYDPVYTNIISGSLPFSFGALLYHERELVSLRPLGKDRLLLLVSVISAGIFLAIVAAVFRKYYNMDWVEVVCFFANLPLNGVAILLLARSSASSYLRRIDTEVGRYSYPFYLLHLLAGIVVSEVLFQQTASPGTLKSVVVLVVALALTAFVSFLLLALVDTPINRLRDSIKKVRTGNIHTSAASSSLERSTP